MHHTLSLGGPPTAVLTLHPVSVSDRSRGSPSRAAASLPHEQHCIPTRGVTLWGSIEKAARLTDGEWAALARQRALAPELLRAYIAHARTIDPVLTDAAIDCIEDEYVAVRQANDDDGPVPTTARTNHALRRLAGASARMRLSEEITVEDVELAIAIHREYLEGVGVDPETGDFDADIVETGASQSQHDRMKQMTTIIEHLEQEEQFDAGAPYEEICSYAADMDFTDEQVDHALEKLCQQGDAYCPQGGDNPTYRLT